MGELAELLQAVASQEEVFDLAASFGARLFEDLSGASAATHARLSIYPDGGVARLRLFGKLA